MTRKTVLTFCVIMLSLSLAACGSGSVTPGTTAGAETAQAPPPAGTTPPPSETPVSLESDEIEIELPNSLGSGDVLFDVYTRKVLIDLNGDGTAEEVEFTAGAEESQLAINGVVYPIARKGLAQRFAIVDVKKGDNILELLFTDGNAPLPDGKYHFSWLYWWNGTDTLFMGGLMDVWFGGEPINEFTPADYFDGNGLVKCLTATDEFTYIEYMGRYEPSGSGRKLKEKLYSADPVKAKKVKCKQPCLLLEERTEKYYSSAWDYYWITNLAPYTEGRVPNVDEGIAIIAQTDEQLTIIKVYGKHWFKLKTSDGYSGWINVADGAVKPYDFTMNWDKGDMFSGL